MCVYVCVCVYVSFKCLCICVCLYVSVCMKYVRVCVLWIYFLSALVLGHVFNTKTPSTSQCDLFSSFHIIALCKTFVRVSLFLSRWTVDTHSSAQRWDRVHFIFNLWEADVEYNTAACRLAQCVPPREIDRRRALRGLANIVFQRPVVLDHPRCSVIDWLRTSVVFCPAAPVETSVTLSLQQEGKSDC